MALPAFQGAKADTDAQKRALLQAVAERGAAGQASFEAQQKAAQAMRADAVRGVAKDIGVTAPPAALAGQLRATAGGPGDVYAREAATQGAAFQAGMGQIGAANDAYMGQLGAAIPVVEATTAREVARIRAEQVEAERQRAYQREQDRLNADQAERQRAFEREGWAREDAAAAGGKTWPNEVKPIDSAIAASGLDEAEAREVAKGQPFKDLVTIANAGVAAGEDPATVMANLRAYEATTGHGLGRSMALITAMFFGGQGSTPGVSRRPTGPVRSADSYAQGR